MGLFLIALFQIVYLAEYGSEPHNEEKSSYLWSSGESSSGSWSSPFKGTGTPF
jgi:hypothetical protein